LVIGHWERDGGTAGQASSGTDAERRRAAWLRGIARNLFLEHCRRVRTSPVKADSASLERAEATWAGEFLREDDGFDFKEALHKCMATLDDKYRRLLEMNYAQGKSRAEIAAAFEMSEDGVKSLLRRVRGSLAECIRKRLTAEGLGSRG
jgi:RNA polymerase sigma-70 factor (ECF subfamily)